MGTPGSGGGPGKPTGGNTSRAPRSDLTVVSGFADGRSTYVDGVTSGQCP
jgi:hypothetical protein